ncbi:hypothetical protein [Oxynema aestuarii]|uniref:Uncharacterized protein n=1 Tax=Oxynema aestuarii AP17 TaxID=2064643 RepID=A0A6H1TZT8_9CYAN|nr:hypothetical protein [Oxynema aestuarii]QIZ70869.1 hypothetical protein HCG48_09955 [Oxynema aestuarii AP17]
MVDGDRPRTWGIRLGLARSMEGSPERVNGSEDGQEGGSSEFSEREKPSCSGKGDRACLGLRDRLL